MYEIQEGIPVFAEKRGYWQNVPRETMQRVIDISESTADWRKVLKEEIPYCERHIVPKFRGDIQHVLPINSQSVILDAGSMWGGLTIPFAQFCKEIHAIDQTWESLRYLGVRANQDGLTNIHLAESTIAALPYSDGKFDHVILNGVLEWIATDEDVVLETDWTEAKKGSSLTKQSSDPELVQLQGLKELHRVINENGSLYVAIENRIALQYFMGYPDDHVNIRFVSFLPRRLADWVTRRVKNHSYRTYLYSPNKLKRLIERAGFDHVDLYSSYPHYNIISRLTPFSDFDRLGALPYNGNAPLDARGKLKVALFSLGWGLVPNPLRKHLAPSISVIAFKGKRQPTRIVAALAKVGILSDESYQAILSNNRFLDHTPTNVLLKRPGNAEVELFVKIARTNNSASLTFESNALKRINELLVGTHLEKSVPQLIYAGLADGVEVQVANYVELTAVEPKISSGLLKMFASNRTPNGIKGLVLRKATRRWQKHSDPSVNAAMKWLASFNKISSESILGSGDELKNVLLNQVERIDPVKQEDARQLVDAIKEVAIGKVQIGTEHGDFDLCNSFLKADGLLFVVDFEHAETGCLPFFDLGNILFSTLCREWRAHGNGLSLPDYARKHGWARYLKKWTRTYATASGMSLDLLAYLPGLSIIGQFAKEFPESRDPRDYPMFDDAVFSAMISWKLEL
ncbi:class I SAM-dependent methyltransferase [Planktomarina sp.]|nr:class I SAM-dependent methyltransferase [Planktomarina sp.]